MASNYITVYVKNPVGDLIEISFDPAHGLDGAAAALTALYPEEYPPHRTSVFSLSDEHTPLNESILCSIVTEPSFCQLISIDQVTLRGTNMSYDRTYRHWHFRLENQEECHVYLEYGPDILQKMKTAIRRGIRISPTFDITYRIPMRIARGNGFRNRSTMLNYVREVISMRDIHVIDAVLMKTMPSGFMEDNMPTEDVFCSCGYVVKAKSMNAHRDTKYKHAEGDKEGRIFLERVKQYVDSLKGTQASP